MNLPKAFGETPSLCPCWYFASKHSRTGRCFCKTVALMLNTTWQGGFLDHPAAPAKTGSTSSVIGGLHRHVAVQNPCRSAILRHTSTCPGDEVT